MRPFLKIDDHIGLHLARPELAGPVFQAIDENREHLRQWLPWVDSTRTMEDTKTFIAESMRQNSDGSRLTTFITMDGMVVGSLGVVHFLKDHRRCELGYWLRQDMQGRGIATRAASCFIEFLFKNKGQNRLEILVIPENQKSRLVAQRLGFQSEGVLRQALLLYGSFRDVEVFSLLKPDWESREKS
jgi:ribosomal-protein-serine acetyltransferase